MGRVSVLHTLLASRNGLSISTETASERIAKAVYAHEPGTCAGTQFSGSDSLSAQPDVLVTPSRSRVSPGGKEKHHECQDAN